MAHYCTISKRARASLRAGVLALLATSCGSGFGTNTNADAGPSTGGANTGGTGASSSGGASSGGTGAHHSGGTGAATSGGMGGVIGQGGIPGIGGTSGTGGISTGGTGGTSTCAKAGEACGGVACCSGLRCCTGGPALPAQPGIGGAASYGVCRAYCPVSDRNLKQGFQSIDADDVLERLSRLPISTWSYRTEPDARHIGPMAQDFMQSFGVGSSDTTILQVDADGVALASIQAILARVERLEAENKALHETVAGLREQVERDCKTLSCRQSSGR